MINKNKKGISAVVATVLIILITIAAVGIIWTAVIPMIRNQISGGTVCFDAEAAVEIGASYSCIEDDDNVKIQVRHTAAGAGDVDLNSVRVKFYLSDGNSVISEWTGEDVPETNAEKAKTIVVTGLEGFPEGLDANNVTEISVIPVVVAGQDTKQCNEGQRVSISACS